MNSSAARFHRPVALGAALDRLLARMPNLADIEKASGAALSCCEHQPQIPVSPHLQASVACGPHEAMATEVQRVGKSVRELRKGVRDVGRDG